MSHTADVFIVDGAGRLRGAFPFGTTAEQMIGTLAGDAHRAAGDACRRAPGRRRLGRPDRLTERGPEPVGHVDPDDGRHARSDDRLVGDLAGGRSPVILTLDGPAGRLNDTSVHVTAQLEAPDGSPVGPPSQAVAVQPPYEDRVLFVPTLDIPSPGSWRLAVSAIVDGAALNGSVGLIALDPGSSAALGGPAPTARTPTLADVGGDHWAVSTDPAPDLRFYQRSTTDALADHAPFVLVVDSVRFRVSPACGKALVLARYLIDRWPAATVHPPRAVSVCGGVRDAGPRGRPVGSAAHRPGHEPGGSAGRRGVLAGCPGSSWSTGTGSCERSTRASSAVTTSMSSCR